MSYIAYNSLLFQIGRQLDQHDRRQLLHMCKLEDEADDIPDALSLLKRLEEKNQLTVDRLGDLEEVLESLEEFSLLGKLKKFEMKRKEYNNLLAQISRALDGDERNHLEQLIDIYRRETSLELEENIPNVRTLFKKLVKSGCLGFRSLDLLKEILTEIERQDLVKEIEDYEERRNKKDTYERSKAKLYSWGKAVAKKVKGVSLKTACKVGRRLLNFADILANWESFSQFIRSFSDRVLPADTELANVSEGCVCFTVQASNINGLTTLWNMYQDGTLKARLYDFLVTDKMKHLADGEENVELTVTIEREEYEKACIDLIDEAIGNGKQPRGRKRRHSDSVLSDIPKEDETPPIKLKRLENEVQLLKERIESQEREMVKLPLEFLETRRATEVVSVEQDQYVGSEWLGSNRLGEDKWHYIKTYVDNLQLETQSLTTETTDSGLGTIGAPSELGVDIADKSEAQSVTGDEWKTVHLAAKTGNVASIETILSRGVDINLKDSNGNTPLIVAAACGNSEAVHYLLDRGADPSVKEGFGRNSLHAASQGGNVAIIETILSRGLDINSKDSNGNTPLMAPAAFGKSEAVHYLLDMGADPSVKGQLGRNALHAASVGGNVAIIETMLSRGLDINSKDSDGNTPLSLAAAFNKSEAVHYLLDRGADLSVKGQFGKNSLHTASKGGNVAIIETLLSRRGFDINSKDSDGKIPLILAAERGKGEAVHYLLDRGADLSVKDKFGRNSLHAASLGGNVAIIETLLSRRGLDINSKDNDGKIPLILAAEHGKCEAVHYLLDRGADLSVKDKLGRNSLHAASLGGNVAIIETMLSRGLDINSKDSNGDTPLLIAATFGKSEAVHYLLDRGADLSVKGNFGRNSLHASSQGGNVDIIEAMLSNGLDINSKDSNGDTPLLIAATFGKSEAVHYLLERGADSSVKGEFGTNALHASSLGGNIAIIETVLSRGLDINSKDRYGRTPLMMAKDEGKTEAVNYLLSKGGR